MSGPENKLTNARGAYGPGIALAVLIAAGFLAFAPGVTRNLPEGVHPDVFRTVGVGKTLTMRLRALDFNPDPGQYSYPSLYADVLALVYLFVPESSFGELDKNLVMIARLVNILFGAAALIFMVKAGKMRGSEWMGLLAGAVLCTSLLFVQRAKYEFVDAAMTCFCAGALAVLPRLTEKPGPGSSIVFGALVGLGVSAKYPAGLMLFPAGIVVLGNLIKQRAPRKEWLYGIGHLAICALAAVLVFIFTSPAIITNFSDYVDGAISEGRNIAAGQMGAVQAHFSDYLVGKSRVPGFDMISNSLCGGFGAGALIAAGIGMVTCLSGFARRRKPEDLALPLTVLVMYVAAAGRGRKLAVQYFMPVFPILALFAALAVRDIAGLIGKSPRLKIAAASIMSVMMLCPSIMQVIKYDRLVLREDTRVECAAWMRENVLAGSVILGNLYMPPVEHAGFVQFWYHPEIHNVVGKLEAEIPPRPREMYAKGYTYFVSTNYVRDTAFDPATAELFPEAARRFQKFYTELDKEELVGEFIGERAGHPGPDIRIYRLSGEGKNIK